MPGTRITSRPLPSRAPTARSTGSATSIACARAPLQQLDHVAEQHQPIDAVERGEQRLERLGAAQHVVSQAGAEMEIGDHERAHGWRRSHTRRGRARPRESAFTGLRHAGRAECCFARVAEATLPVTGDACFSSGAVTR